MDVVKLFSMPLLLTGLALGGQKEAIALPWSGGMPMYHPSAYLPAGHPAYRRAPAWLPEGPQYRFRPDPRFPVSPVQAVSGQIGRVGANRIAQKRYPYQHRLGWPAASLHQYHYRHGGAALPLMVQTYKPEPVRSNLIAYKSAIALQQPTLSGERLAAAALAVKPELTEVSATSGYYEQDGIRWRFRARDDG